MAFEDNTKLLAFTCAELPPALLNESSDDHKALHTFYNAAILTGVDVDSACVQARKRLQDMRNRAAAYKAWREEEKNASDAESGDEDSAS